MSWARWIAGRGVRSRDRVRHVRPAVARHLCRPERQALDAGRLPRGDRGPPHPYFGDVALRALTREHVERYLAAKLGAVHPEGHRRAGQPVWQPKTVHCFTWPEGTTAIGAGGEPWALVIRTAALTGLRKGELSALRWSDVELGAGRLHVQRSFGRYGFGTPKSAAGRRVVPLSAGLVGELRRHKLARSSQPRRSRVRERRRHPARPEQPHPGVGQGAPSGRAPAPDLPLVARYRGVAAHRP